MRYPTYVIKLSDGRKESVGSIDNRAIKIVFAQKTNYIKIITLI